MLFRLVCMLLLVLLSSACRAMLITPASETEGHDVIEIAIARRHPFELSPDAVRVARKSQIAPITGMLESLKTSVAPAGTVMIEAPPGIGRQFAAFSMFIVILPWCGVLLLRSLMRRIDKLQNRKIRITALFKQKLERPPRILRPRVRK